jgi:purine-binding chemotaxis protein CheW
MEKQLVIFELGAENFGIDISSVESIVKMQEITSIPCSPDFIEGVTSHRGAILPVIDMGKRFSIPSLHWDKDSRIVVVTSNGMRVGMIVSAVSEVVTIDESIIEPPPPIVTSIQSKFISGIINIDSKLVIMLDLNLVLSKQEINSLSELALV